MVRSHVGGFVALILLLIISISVKLPQYLNPAELDEAALRQDLVSAVEDSGYSATTRTGNWWNRGLVSASKGGCTIYLRDATYFGPDLEAVTSRRMNEGRPIRYVRSGIYLSSYPRISIEIAWRLQRDLARLGWHYTIDPVLAVGARDRCWPDAQILKKVQLRYKKKSSTAK
jgi:hypothetical protein